MPGSDSENDEYTQMHKEYQFIEKVKVESTKDSTTILAKQQALIDKYKTDNDKLKRDCRAHLRKPRGQIAEDVLTRLSDQEFRHEKKIIKEKKKIEEYDKQIEILQDRIRTIRGNMGGVNYALDSHKMTTKQINILENRLEKSLTRFNEALSRNRELREQIDTLRRERVVCEGIYKSMEKQLHDKETYSAQLVENTNRNVKLRDQARTDLSTIEQLNNEEHLEFDNQISKYDQEEAELAYLEEHKYDNYKNNLVDKDNDDFITLSEFNSSNDNDIYQTPDIKMRIQSYKESFEKIKSATGIENIEELVEKFISHEDQNFSLFNFVSTQTNEIEQLEDSILKLKDEELKVNEDGGNDLNQHEQSKKDLKVKLEIIHTTCEKYEKEYQECLRTFNDLKESIQSIFKTIRCDELSISDFIKDEDLSETNIMQFLGIIEHRSIDLIRIYHSIDKNMSYKKEQPIAPKVNIESRMKIQAPEIDEYTSLELESDEDVIKPHDLNKIKEDIYKQLATRTVNRRRSGTNRRN